VNLSIAERKRLGAARCACVTRAVACSAATHNPRWVPTATASVLDHGDVVMFSSPIDSAIQAHGVITPWIVRSSMSLGRVARCPNRGAQRSVISLAVGDCSTSQDFVASKGSRLGNNCRDVSPAVGSRSGIPPHHVTWRQARRSFARRPASGNQQASSWQQTRWKQTPGHHGQ
jgi:hypothetical protein